MTSIMVKKILYLDVYAYTLCIYVCVYGYRYTCQVKEDAKKLVQGVPLLQTESSVLDLLVV